MRNFFDAANEREVLSPTDGYIKMDSEISRAEGGFIERIISQNKPKRTIEIGCRFGVSSHYICRALREVGGTEHVIVDAGQRLGTRSVGLYNLLRSGYGDIVSLINGPSQYVLPRMLNDAPTFDFALIDGAHTFDHTLIDFFFLDRLIPVGGIIAFDDADWPAIRKVCRFVFRNRHYDVVDFVGSSSDNEDFWNSTSSMVAFRKTDNDILGKTRMFDHFEDF